MTNEEKFFSKLVSPGPSMLYMADRYGFKRFVQAVQRGNMDPTFAGAVGDFDWQPYIVNATSQVFHWNESTLEWI